MTRAFEQDLDRIVPLKAEYPATIRQPLFGNRGDIGRERDPVRGPQPLGVAHECLPAPQVDPFVQRRPDPRFTAPSFKLGRDHAGIVENQNIAAPKLLRQVAHGQIGERSLRRNHQHTRRIARPRRTQRDPFRGKFEIEQVNAHKISSSQA